MDSLSSMSKCSLNLTMVTSGMMYRSFSLLLKETPGLGFSDLMIWQYPAASAWDRCSFLAMAGIWFLATISRQPSMMELRMGVSIWRRSS